MKMITVLLLSFVLIMSPVTGAIWFPSPPHDHQPKERISEKIKLVGEKATEVVGKVGSMVANALGSVSLGDKIIGTCKDSVVKIKDWDAIDSPKRIGEDIEQNASLKIEQGVEEVKEKMENVKETNVNELLTRPKNAIRDVLFMDALEKVRSVISFCYLLGFSTAYGIGVWVTFFSSSVLGKCLPKQQLAMVLNKINMVYFRAMAYCVGASVFGYFVTHARKAAGFFNKMEMFQGFNLVSGLLMIFINLFFLLPRASKLIDKGMKEKSLTESVALEKLKKVNTYSSTLNASTMVMLTWHLAYIGQLLQVRH